MAPGKDSSGRSEGVVSQRSRCRGTCFQEVKGGGEDERERGRRMGKRGVFSEGEGEERERKSKSSE